MCHFTRSLEIHFQLYSSYIINLQHYIRVEIIYFSYICYKSLYFQ